MKLGDIKDWDKIKLSNIHIKSKYVKWHYDDEVFYDDIDERWYEDVFMLVEDTNWEVYEEPRVAKLDKKDIIYVLDKEIDGLSSALHSLNSALINIKYLREKIKE